MTSSGHIPIVRLALLLTALLLPAAPTAAQTADNVLLVVNAASPESVAVGEHYARARGLAADHVVRVTAPTTETVGRTEFNRAIQEPIERWVWRHGLQDRILYIVLTKGVPIRIAGTGGRDATLASVDSELTLLYRRMVGRSPAVLGREANPYFLDDGTLAEARPFTRFASDLYLVTRLDGYTVDDVGRLIDRGLAPSRQGLIVLDQRATLRDAGGDRWLADAASRLERAGQGSRVLLESTTGLAKTDNPVLGYFSWGSNDPANQLRGSGGLTFASGALAGLFVSTDGRTFRDPPADWKPGISSRPPGQFGSGSQSMAADFIREGATGVSAHVAEPYLDGAIRPQVLFPAYLAGFNLAESFYLAMPYLSWQTIVVGDPLVAPFRDAPIPPEALHGGVDPDTELPAVFAERRLAVLSQQGLDVGAQKLVLRAEGHLARDDTARAEALMAQAVDREPRLVGTAMLLAGFHEARKEHDQARARYRQVLAVDPDNVLALNNLAYSLAAYAGQPKEALPLAQRAMRLSTLGMVADTLGWIHYLLGDYRQAAFFIERAVERSPGTAEIQLHAAFVHAQTGEIVRARRELAAALELDPSLAERDDVRDLQQKVGGIEIESDDLGISNLRASGIWRSGDPA
jgi:uncharacterized protein (TIGR03790 family)